ncbi:MAG TPA: hypothetical protein VMM35_12595 [Longimicrobiales bacterium]|nr:hypothetical protein [Longimicrobiales bacterium]
MSRPMYRRIRLAVVVAPLLVWLACSESPTELQFGEELELIVWEAGRDGNKEIYVMNADGSNPKRLTHHPADDGNPAWSPDGRKIAFHLRGRHLRHRGTRVAVRSAIEHFERAVATDPGYAMAYAQLAGAYVEAASNRELPYDQALQAARRAAERATQLAPTLPEAHAALGRVQLELWDWTTAEREARLALQLDRRNASAHATYTQVLLVQGRTDEAVAVAALAAQLEPLSATAANDYAEALRADRQYERAAEVHRRALELEPGLGRQNLAKVYLELAMYDSALVQFRAALAAGAPRFQEVDLLWTAYTYARAGRRDEATSLLRQFEAQSQGPVGYLPAAVYLALGERERAFQLMERGIEERSQPAWRQLGWDPIWDPVRGDERFLRLLERISLASGNHGSPARRGAGDGRGPGGGGGSPR